MSSVRIIEHGSAEEASDLALAQQVGDALSSAYPNHPWAVAFQGGNLIVRHMAISDAVRDKIGKDGFGSLLPRGKVGTPTELTHTAVMFGGELLEAFGLKRGAWDGTWPTVPAGWKRGKQREFQ